jgi:hypothetical protein
LVRSPPPAWSRSTWRNRRRSPQGWRGCPPCSQEKWR